MSSIPTQCPECREEDEAQPIYYQKWWTHPESASDRSKLVEWDVSAEINAKLLRLEELDPEIVRLTARVAELEAENKNLREASVKARRHLAQAQRFLTLFWNADSDAITRVRPQITRASECLARLTARAGEGE